MVGRRMWSSLVDGTWWLCGSGSDNSEYEDGAHAMNTNARDGEATRNEDVGDVEEGESVYELVSDMLAVSVAMYLFGDLREMARQHQLPSSTTLHELEPPMSTTKMLQLIQQHRQYLKRNLQLPDMTVDSENHEYDNNDDDDDDLYENRGQMLSPNENNNNDHEQEYSLLQSTFNDSYDDNTNSASSSSRLMYFADEHSHSNMVDAIFVNDVKKRITVAFRGSVTKHDFAVDVHCWQTQVDNPIKEELPHVECMGVHSGFHDYLHKPTSTNNPNSTTRLQSIYTSILTLLNLHPGYALVLTGHSMGGALATLCAIHASTYPPIIEKCGCITLLTLASPKVGNKHFCKVHKHLEETLRLRHVRVVNQGDFVPLIPIVTPRKAQGLWMVGVDLYRHVGVRLLLPKHWNGGEAELRRLWKRNGQEEEEEERRSILGSLAAVAGGPFRKLAKVHLCQAYKARLDACQTGLLQVTVDDLYHDVNMQAAQVLFSEQHTEQQQQQQRIVNYQQEQGSDGMWVDIFSESTATSETVRRVTVY